MSKFHSIHVALEVAQARRDTLVKQLATAEASLQHAQGQLKQLGDYVVETDSRMVCSGRTFPSMEVVRHQHQFMARLEHAIKLQSQVVAGATQQRDHTRSLLVEAEGKVAVLEKLLAMRAAEQRRLDYRRDQVAMDEFAQNMFARVKSLTAEGEPSWL